MDDREELKKLIESTDVLSEPERKYWLDLLPTMSPAQMQQLRSILESEKKNLDEIDRKYDDQLEKIAQKYLSKWDSEKSKSTRLKRQKEEKKEEESSSAKAEELLKQYNS